MKTLYFLLLVSFLIVLGGCADINKDVSPVSVQSEQMEMSKVPVPFKMVFDGIVTLTPTGPYTGTSITEGGGTATHTGLFTSVTTTSYALTSPTSGNLFDGSHTLTAANGDKIYATFTGSWVINSDGIYEYTCQMVFTGGTGRFTDIEGVLDFLATGENISDLQKTMHCEASTYITF